MRRRNSVSTRRKSEGTCEGLLSGRRTGVAICQTLIKAWMPWRGEMHEQVIKKCRSASVSRQQDEESLAGESWHTKED